MLLQLTIVSALQLKQLLLLLLLLLTVVSALRGFPAEQLGFPKSVYHGG